MQIYKMITARIKLGDVVKKGLQELVDHRDCHCKILMMLRYNNM
jgi:hypothetical protein